MKAECLNKSSDWIDSSSRHIYDEIHVFVFALSRFDKVRYDYFEAVRKAVAKKRTEITQSVPRGPKRTAALKEFEETKMQFESEML